MNHFEHRLCNASLAPAEGDEDSVDTLHVQQGSIQGVRVTRSFWKPEPAELALLLRGGCVMLSVYGSTHAPVRVDAMVGDSEADQQAYTLAVEAAVRAADEAGYVVEVYQEPLEPLAMSNVRTVVESRLKFLRVQP